MGFRRHGLNGHEKLICFGGFVDNDPSNQSKFPCTSYERYFPELGTIPCILLRLSRNTCFCSLQSFFSKNHKFVFAWLLRISSNGFWKVFHRAAIHFTRIYGFRTEKQWKSREPGIPLKWRNILVFGKDIFFKKSQIRLCLVTSNFIKRILKGIS